MVNSLMIETTVYDRNRIGDLTRIIEPWGGQRQWTREGSGRLESSTDSSGRTRTYTHDAMGWRTTIVATGGGRALLILVPTFGTAEIAREDFADVAVCSQLPCHHSVHLP